MRILILFLLLLSCHGADTKLPSDVQTLLTAYDKDMAKIQADADAASAARTEKLRPLLVKAQEAATKKGDLDSAMAVKGEIDKLKVQKESPPESNIVSATWGEGDATDLDVTEFVKNITVPSKITVNLFGSDPAPNSKKVLTITKMVKGRKTKITIPEHTIYDPSK